MHEPRWWHQGSKGRTSEGIGELGAIGPSHKTNAVLRTRFPVSRKKLASDLAEARVLRSSFLCLGELRSEPMVPAPRADLRADD
jgi:hypothetical protein